MALVKCSECGHQISDHALACPSCGAPILQKANSLPPPPPLPVTKPSFSPLEIAAVGLGLASLFMPYFVAVFSVPATFICALILLNQGKKKAAIASMVLALFGLIGIISVSYQIEKAQDDLRNSLERLKRAY